MVDGPSRVFRNNTYPVIGWVLVASGAVMGALWLLLADDRTAQVVCPAFAWSVAVLGFLGYARPRVVAAEDGVTVVNPFRTVRLRWDEIERFEAGRQLHVVLRDGRGVVGVWSVQAANAARMLGRTSHADRVAEDLNRLAARHRRSR